uniref:Uncharacterized protein n=1 Tax=Arion vulgaris TaxID=1028688 RepID=A0A0B6Y603_9EUPU
MRLFERVKLTKYATISYNKTVHSQEGNTISNNYTYFLLTLSTSHLCTTRPT